MYIGEPSRLPVRVSDWVPLSVACSIFTLATPKSRSLTMISSSSARCMKILAGLTSRWIMPASCAFSSPRQICATIRMASDGAKEPTRVRTSSTPSPWSNSITV